MKKEKLLEKENYMKNVKSKRLHIFTTEEVEKEVERYVEEFKLYKSDVIALAALSFQSESVSKKLDDTLSLLGVSNFHISDEKKEQVRILAKKYKGETAMSENKKTKELSKTAQFHLRVTPEAYEEIKRKATEFGMTISDYVAFVTLHFDVMDISEKIDEINAKLDEMRNKN